MHSTTSRRSNYFGSRRRRHEISDFLLLPVDDAHKGLACQKNDAANSVFPVPGKSPARLLSHMRSQAVYPKVLSTSFEARAIGDDAMETGNGPKSTFFASYGCALLVGVVVSIVGGAIASGGPAKDTEDDVEERFNHAVDRATLNQQQRDEKIADLVELDRRRQELKSQSQELHNEQQRIEQELAPEIDTAAGGSAAAPLNEPSLEIPGDSATLAEDQGTAPVPAPQEVQVDHGDGAARLVGPGPADVSLDTWLRGDDVPRMDQPSITDALPFAVVDLAGPITAAPAAMFSTFIDDAMGPGMESGPLADAFSLVTDRATKFATDSANFQESATRAVDRVRDKLPKMIEEEIQNGVAELQEKLSEEPPAVDPSFFDVFPSVTLMIGTLIAPLQLDMLGARSSSFMGISSILLGIDLLTLGLSQGESCLSFCFFFLGKDNAVRTFIAADALILAFSIGVNLGCYSEYRHVKELMEQERESAPEFTFTGDLQSELRKQVDCRLTNGLRAMRAYDKCVLSSKYRLLPFLNIGDFFLQMFGVVVLFNTPGRFCHAPLLLPWFRARTMLFLIGLIPRIVALGWHAATAMVQNESFATALLAGGQSLDKSVGGPPVCTILIRALWMRDESDIARVELRLLQQDHEKATIKLQEISGVLEAKRTHAAGMQAKAETASASLHNHLDQMGENAQEQVFLTAYQNAIREVVQLGVAGTEAVQTAEALAAGDPTALLRSIPGASSSSAVADVESPPLVAGSGGTGEG